MLELFEYQKKNVQNMTKMKRCILADPMGLGKTISTIATIDYLKLKKILIVAPAALLSNWRSEILKFSSLTLSDDCVIVKGNKTQRQEILKEDYRIYIINKEMLQMQDVKYLNKNGKEVKKKVQKYPDLDKDWDCIIIDEYHHFRNHKTKMFVGLKHLTSEYLFGLTGTPMKKSPDNFFALLNIIDKANFSSYWNFVNDCLVVRQGLFGQSEIVGIKDIVLFEAMLKKYMIKNNRNECDLPPKTYKNIFIDLPEDVITIYVKILKEMIYECKQLPKDSPDYLKRLSNSLEQTIRLQQLCLHPALLGLQDESVKVKEILEILEQTDGQVVIISKFKKFLRLLSNELLINGHTHILYTGDLSQHERDIKLKEFQDGKKRVFLGTLAISAEGLNLQNAQTLIMTDKSWLPTDNEQVEARIYRTGQTKNTLIINLICKGTIEEYIEQVTQDRGKIINEVMLLKEYLGV